mgnify:CR=1 FL=1
MDIAKLLTRVSNYVERSGEPEWQVGKKLFKDTRALPKLQDGWRGNSVQRLEDADKLLTDLEAKLRDKRANARSKKKPNASKLVA